MFKQIRYVLGVVLFSFSIVALAVTSQKGVSILYTQSSPVVTIKTVNNNTLLTLQKISGKTIWFTDRPSRSAGRLGIDEYLRLWTQGKNNFSKAQPNALFMYSSKTEVKKNICHNIVVELSNPLYNKKDDSLTYQIIPIDKTVAKIPNGTYYHIMLFIDNNWCPLGGRNICLNV